MADAVTDEMLGEFVIIGIFEEIACQMRDRWAEIATTIATTLDIDHPASARGLTRMVDILHEPLIGQLPPGLAPL
jgi:hypothetical protein